MKNLVYWIDQALYPEYTRNWDDLIFRKMILSKLNQRAVVLDLGAGAGIVEQMNFRGLAARVCGVDLDARVLSNPMLDEAKVSDAARIPYSDSTFDVVFSCNVIEHLPNPEIVFSEVWRVLRPGGIFIFKTPNLWHYMPMIARMTPYRFHKFINRIRGRAEVDTFPTLYRANSSKAVSKLAAKTGFLVERISLIEGRPEYLRISWLTYLFGAAYERIVNSSEIFAMFRILMIAELRKPQEP
jgi:SAM-dependent methyltransferase